VHNSLQDYTAAATTYVVAMLTMFGTLVADNYTTVVQVLGFVLLVARLVQELPRAATIIMSSLKRTTVSTETSNTVTTVERTLKKKSGA